MKKKFLFILAVCVASQILLAPAEAQVWSELAAPNTVDIYYPAIVTNRPVRLNGQFTNQLDVYVHSSANTVRVNGQTYSCRNRSGHPICGYFFSGWVELGGNPISVPSAVGWNNHREVFILSGNDLDIWGNTSDDNSTWSGWSPLGAPGQMCSRPSAVSPAAGRV